LILSRSLASGFCIVNDVVLGIEVLLERFRRVLYVDIDIHHGDGVEAAFESTSSVTTLSFHRHEVGFFPGTGKVSDIGKGKGKYHSINVPLDKGLSPSTFVNVFETVFTAVFQKICPDVIVMQTGVDSMNKDPLGDWNLDVRAIGEAVSLVHSTKVPLLLLGGGGYNSQNCAKAWAYCTGVVSGIQLSNEIPEHEHWPEYAPDFELHTQVSLVQDENLIGSKLKDTISLVLHNIAQLPSAINREK
jgi:histone deacetylase 8